MSQAGTINVGSAVIPGDVAINFVTNNGTAQSVANTLDVFGVNGITTSGSGNVLTINGFNPNLAPYLYDDFIQNNSGLGQLQWRSSSVNDQVNGTATNPGLLKIANSASSGIFLGNDNFTEFSYVLGGGVLSLNWVISLVTLSTAGNRYLATLGMTDNKLSGTPTNGIYFSYTDNVNGGQWVLNCTSASVTTSVNTTIAAVTGFVNLGITINAAATSISFTINGVSAGSAIVANIPTTGIGPSAQWARSAGSLPASLIDLFYLTQTLTTPR